MIFVSLKSTLFHFVMSISRIFGGICISFSCGFHRQEKPNQMSMLFCKPRSWVYWTGKGTGGESSSFIHIYLYILVVLRLVSQTCRPQGVYSHQQHGQGQMRKRLLFITGLRVNYTLCKFSVGRESCLNDVTLLYSTLFMTNKDYFVLLKSTANHG